MHFLELLRVLSLPALMQATPIEPPDSGGGTVPPQPAGSSNVTVLTPPATVNAVGVFEDTAGNMFNGANGPFVDAATGYCAIGASAPGAGAALDIVSTNAALYVPRMTEVQRDALTVTFGAVVYNTDASELQWYDGAAWVSASGGGGGNVNVTTPTTAGRVATWNDAIGGMTSSTNWSITGSTIASLPASTNAQVSIGQTDLAWDNSNEWLQIDTNGYDFDVRGRYYTNTMTDGMYFQSLIAPVDFETNNFSVANNGLDKLVVTDSFISLGGNAGYDVRFPNIAATQTGKYALIDAADNNALKHGDFSQSGSSYEAFGSGNVTFNVTTNPGIDELALFSTAGQRTISSSANLDVAVLGQLDFQVAGRVSAAASTGPFVPPKLTTTQRDGLTAVSGDQIYNTTVNKLQWYNGTSWVDAEGGGGAGNVTVTTPTTAGRLATWNDAAGDLTPSTAWSVSGSDIASVPAAADASIQVGNTTLTYVHASEQTTLDAQGFDFENISRYYINTAPDGMFFQSLDQIAFSGNDFTFSTGGPPKFSIASNAVTVNLSVGNDLRINNLSGGVGTIMSIDPAASNKVRVSSLKEPVVGSFEIQNNTGTQLNLTHVAGVDGLLLVSTPTAKVISSPTELELGANNEIILGGDKGVRFPSLTTTQRDALTPVAGTQIFNSTVSKIQWYNGSAWVDAEGGGGGGNVNTTTPTTARGLAYWDDTAANLSDGSTGPWVDATGERMSIGDDDQQALFTVANGAVPAYPFPPGNDIITLAYDDFQQGVGAPTQSLHIKQFDPTNGRVGLNGLANLLLDTTFSMIANFDSGISEITYNYPGGTSKMQFTNTGSVIAGNGTAPSDALLSVGGDSSSTQGYFYPPLVTQTDRDAMTPVAGAQVYNSDVNKLQWYDGTGWVNAEPGAGGGNVNTTTPTSAGNVATWANASGGLTQSSSFSIAGNTLSNPNSGSTLQLENLRIEGNPLAMYIAAEGGPLSTLNINSDDTIRFDALDYVFSGTATESADFQQIYSIRLPGLTTAQRDAQSGVLHDFIYNDTLGAVQYNNGSAWVSLANAGAGGGNVTATLPTTTNRIATWNNATADLTSDASWGISGNVISNIADGARIDMLSFNIASGTTSTTLTHAGGGNLNIDSDNTIDFDATTSYVFNGNKTQRVSATNAYSVALPTLTTTQRNAGTPVLGDFLYNTTDTELQYYDGATWQAVGAGGGGGNVSTTLPTTANRLTWWNDTAGALVNTSNWQVGTFGTQDLANTTSSARITLGPSSNIRNSSGTLFIEGGNGLTLDSNNGMLLTSLAGNVTLNANTQGVNLNGNTINLSAGIPNQINITTTTTTFDPGSGNNIVFNNIPVGTGDTLVLDASNQLRRSTGGGGGNVTVTTPTTLGRIATWNDTVGGLVPSTTWEINGPQLQSVPTLADATFILGDTLFDYDNLGEATVINTNNKDLFVTTRETYFNPSDYFSVQTFGDLVLSTGGQFRVSGLSSGTGTAVVADGFGNFFTQTSSRRYKKNIEDYVFNEGFVDFIKPRVFEYKKGQSGKVVGLIAEEVAEVLPEFVNMDENGLPDSISYDRMVVALISEVKFLRGRVAKLEAAASESSMADDVRRLKEEMAVMRRMMAKIDLNALRGARK